MLERGEQGGIQAIPLTLQQSLTARLDRLGSARKLAQIGAVIGRDFSYALLRAVAAMEDGPLQAALDRLADADILLVQGLPPDANYHFKHALIRDAAYENLLKSRRQVLHRHAGEVLRGQFIAIAAAEPELLAYHFTQAGMTEAAIEWWGKAGHRSLARSAMLEAEAQLRKGIDLVASLPESTERQQFELDLQVARSTALVAMQSPASLVAENFLRARQLCDQLVRPSQLAVLLVGQCAYHLGRAELVLACQESTELLDLGKAQNDAAVKLAGCAFSAGTEATSPRPALMRNRHWHSTTPRILPSGLRPHSMTR